MIVTPFAAGAVHDTLIDEDPPVAVTSVGAPGTSVFSLVDVEGTGVGLLEVDMVELGAADAPALADGQLVADGDAETDGNADALDVTSLTTAVPALAEPAELGAALDGDADTDADVDADALGAEVEADELGAALDGEAEADAEKLGTALGADGLGVGDGQMSAART